MSSTTGTPVPHKSPYEMKDDDKTAHRNIPTVKAFENPEYLHSRDARILRMMCEFQEPQLRLKRNHVKGTILFFGSARSMSRGDYTKTLAALEKEVSTSPDAELKAQKEAKVARFKKVEWMCKYAELAEELSRRLTQWAMEESDFKSSMMRQPDYLTGAVEADGVSKQPLVVLTGGGPGIMEAANRGAASVPGAKSMGMGITLPFEKGLNPYVTPDLAFEFHYFFTRKFWMMYSAKALVVGPGGFGTFDELFELLTLRQTGKLPGDLPIVLLGKDYWKTVINWQAMADYGVISQEEVDKLCFADAVEEAYDHIVERLTSSIRLEVAMTPQRQPEKAPLSSVPPMGDPTQS